MSDSDSASSRRDFAATIYRLRWPLTLVLLAATLVVVYLGTSRIGRFTERLASLGDTGNGLGAAAEPKIFDSRYDIWFDADDVGLQTYKAIEDMFVAEDPVLIAFEAPDAEFGVFSREALTAIARLTRELEKVPGVRHVRSLTSNPWIRYGVIEENGPGGEPEYGLAISDLVEGDPNRLSERALIERMIAVLGAERAAGLATVEKVRGVLGRATPFEDHIGEPRLLDTIVSGDGRTTAIQVQVLRTRLEPGQLDEVFGDDLEAKTSAPNLYVTDGQWATLRGIRHVLRSEYGLAVRTPDYERLQSWIESQPEGPEQDALLRDLENPSKNFMIGPDGAPLRKYFEYDRMGDGTLVDRSNPADPIVAPADFEPQPLSPYAFFIGGMPLFEQNFLIVGMEDMKLVGVMFAVIAVVLLIVFRRLSGVILPLLVVFASVLGMLGWLWLSGDLLNNLTAITPNMVTAVGVADAVHLIAAWVFLSQRFDDRKALIIEVIRRNALPVFLTSITTAVGFFALLVSDLFPMRGLGFAAGTGVVFAYGFSMTMIPALLSILPIPGRGFLGRRKAGDAGELPKAGELKHWSEGLVGVVYRFQRAILISAVVAILAAAVGLWRLRIDTDFRTAFPDDNPVMVDMNWIEGKLGGVGDLEIIFQAPELIAEPEAAQRFEELMQLRTLELGQREHPEEFSAMSAAQIQRLAELERLNTDYSNRRVANLADFLERVNRFEARLREEMGKADSPLRVVSDITSPLDILRKIHQVQNENKASYYRVPTEEDVAADARQPRLSYEEWTEEWDYQPAQSASTLAAQYYLQYENGAKPAENLSTQISADRRTFRMQARVEQAPSEVHLAAFDLVRDIARTEFPALAGSDEQIAERSALTGMTLSGKSLLYSGMIKSFTNSYIRSMGLALLVITIMIGLIFRSPLLAVVSMIPNILPILMPIGALGLLGIEVDGPSVLVSSVALGVCVDDTLHFLTKFTRAKRAGCDTRESLRLTFREVGSALAITTLTLVLGFAVLGFSQFKPNFMMGQLAVAMIALAWVADFLITPALLSVLPESTAATSSSTATLTQPSKPQTA